MIRHLVSNYSQTSTNGHLSVMAAYLCPGGESIQYFLFKSLYNGNLLKRQWPLKPVPNDQFFQRLISETDEKVKNGHEILFVWLFDD